MDRTFDLKLNDRLQQRQSLFGTAFYPSQQSQHNKKTFPQNKIFTRQFLSLRDFDTNYTNKR